MACILPFEKILIPTHFIPLQRPEWWHAFCHLRRSWFPLILSLSRDQSDGAMFPCMHNLTVWVWISKGVSRMNHQTLCLIALSDLLACALSGHFSTSLI
jgi:hypothetical protein